MNLQNHTEAEYLDLLDKTEAEAFKWLGDKE